MISVVFIINNEKNFKNFKNINYNELYKKCGYKSNDNFLKLYEKKINCNVDNNDSNVDNNDSNVDSNIYYEYWGKNLGKESFKYEFDNITYFNKLLIIKKDGENFLNINENDIALIDETYNINKEVNNSNNNCNENISENNNEKLLNNKIIDQQEDINNDTNSELSEEPYLFTSDEEED